MGFLNNLFTLSLQFRPSYWDGRSPGKLMIEDHDGPCLIDMMRKVLSTNAPDYWVPMEPGAKFAFYPGMDFPFLPPHMQLLWESDERRQIREQEEQAREDAVGVLPTDLVQVIALIDAENFRDSSGYAGSGLAIILSPTRLELEEFCEQLFLEYENAPINTNAKMTWRCMMAILSAGRMALEVAYAGFDNDRWLGYHFRFLEKDEPFIKDGMLLGTGASYWNNRVPGGFMTQEHLACSLLPTLEQAIDALEPVTWVPTEPWFIVEFIPNRTFPIHAQRKSIPVSQRAIEAYQARDERRRMSPALPEDPMTVIAMPVTEAWADDFYEFDSGPALILVVYREQLRSFYLALKAEYEALPNKPDIDE